MTGPACAGLWHLFDSTLLADHQRAAALCAVCPMLEACRALLEDTEKPSGTWAGKLYGQSTRAPKWRIPVEEAMFTDDEARAAHRAYNTGDRSDRARIGERVYNRRFRRLSRAVA